MTRSILTLALTTAVPRPTPWKTISARQFSWSRSFLCWRYMAIMPITIMTITAVCISNRPDPKMSTAENFLRLLRPDASYTELEAKVLDIALILHMEHGGGNNSTFTTRVVTSSGSDIYSAVAAAMSSLKGPKQWRGQY